MGQALYRKYRSKSLDEIVGQSHITDMLRRAIKADRIAHAYLLTGPRGVGKTSIARILAHEINQLPYKDESTHLDIIEIDAASNNSVEDIRDLRDKVMIAPSSARKKIYIIDEVHMLSKQAFNALLKTLEEPPEHVVFILATTDADKLPATIISRVQRFNFRLIHSQDAVTHLRMIADAEKITIDDDALLLIARHGGGSFRDSISLLDQLQNLSEGAVTKTLIEQVLGLASDTLVDTLLTAHLANDNREIVRLLEHSEQQGTPALLLTDQLAHVVRDRILAEPALLPLLDSLLEVPKSPWPHIKLLSALCTRTSLQSSETAQPVTARESEKKSITSPSAPAPQAPKAPETPSLASTAPHQDKDFEWPRFVDEMKQQSPGAASLLAKLGHRIHDSVLTIYAGKKFTKTRLDKSLPDLAKAAKDAGFAGDIVISADTTPPTNSQTAAVLDIMGGGEEVNLK